MRAYARIPRYIFITSEPVCAVSASAYPRRLGVEAEGAGAFMLLMYLGYSCSLPAGM